MSEGRSAAASSSTRLGQSRQSQSCRIVERALKLSAIPSRTVKEVYLLDALWGVVIHRCNCRRPFNSRHIHNSIASNGRVVSEGSLSRLWFLCVLEMTAGTRPCWIPVLRAGQVECCGLRLRYTRTPREPPTTAVLLADLCQSTNRRCSDHTAASYIGPASPVRETQGQVSLGWNGSDDPAAPRNWPAYRKWLISVVGFAFCS